VGLLFELSNESACPWLCHLEIINTEKQEEPVAGCGVVRARQRRMLIRGPLVEAEQHSSVRIEDLTEVGMGGSASGWPKRDWYHLKLAGTSLTPIIVHVRFMAFLPPA
jgi:hypothetical protein